MGCVNSEEVAVPIGNVSTDKVLITFGATLIIETEPCDQTLNGKKEGNPELQHTNGNNKDSDTLRCAEPPDKGHNDSSSEDEDNGNRGKRQERQQH